MPGNVVQPVLAKTYSQYVQYIKLMLGAVDGNEDSLEYMNDTLTEFVKIAFSEIQPYINYRKRWTIPWMHDGSGAIDFNQFGIRAVSVTAVKRGSTQGMVDGNAVIANVSMGSWMSGWYLPIGGTISSSYDPITMQMLMLKATNSISGDKHFIFDYGKQYLFINFNQQFPSSITVDFIPEITSSEQIDDSYWQNILQQYSLALVKISLSHYRGKFRQVNGQPFELDYEKLANEGKEERQQIWTDLVDNNLLNYRFD